MHADLLIHAQWVLPVEPDDRQLGEHAVAIADGRILAVLPSDEARAAFAAQRSVELPGHVLIPGLVNAHTHAAMTLMRGLADDLPFTSWLHEHMWPAERRWVDQSFVAEGTRLAVLEMLLSGTTCFADMYFFPDIVAQVAAECGIRAVVGMVVFEFPTAYAATIDQYFTNGLTVLDQYREHPLIRVAFAPHSSYACSDATLARLQTLASELDILVQTHVNETNEEIVHSLREYGERPLDRLERLGLLGPNFIAVHMTQVTDEEIARIADSRVNVVHCPESNMKLANGFCPVTRLQAAGVNVALGTDGACSNNDLSLIGEMRSAALLAKAVAKSAAALPAATALRMATIDAAKALGLDADIGSIEPGKAADLVAIDLRDPATQPVYNPLAQLVYAAGRHQVRQVWIQGRQVVRDGVATKIAVADVFTAVEAWRQRLSGRV